jgi:hypothetical protein
VYPRITTGFQISTPPPTASTFLYYHDFSILSPPTWKLDYQDPNADIRQMLTQMSSSFTFSQFALSYHDYTLSLLSSSPDGYSRLSQTLVNTDTGAMTIIPKPTDLSILYLPERHIQANVSKVGNAITLSPDQQRLYVSYYLTDNQESKVYHKDQTSADFPSTPLLNLRHVLCGAISIFTWDDSTQQWTLHTTTQHPFGGLYDAFKTSLTTASSSSSSSYDGYGDRIVAWTKHDYVLQTDTYMFTTVSHGNTLVTYEESLLNGDITLYHYDKPAQFTNGWFLMDQEWCVVATLTNTIQLYQWSHRAKTLTLKQTISIANAHMCSMTNDALWVYNTKYGYDSTDALWKVKSSISYSSYVITQIVTDPLGQILVAIINPTATDASYLIFDLTITPPRMITRTKMTQSPIISCQIQVISYSCFFVIMTTPTSFVCDVYKSNQA